MTSCLTKLSFSFLIYKMWQLCFLQRFPIRNKCYNVIKKHSALNSIKYSGNGGSGIEVVITQHWIYNRMFCICVTMALWSVACTNTQLQWLNQIVLRHLYDYWSKSSSTPSTCKILLPLQESCPHSSRKKTKDKWQKM